MEDEEIINERKGLLQNRLPGVTLPNGNPYYHRRQPSSDLSSLYSHEVDQLQQQILISKALNKISDDDRYEDSTIVSGSVSSSRRNTYLEDSSGINILWIDRKNSGEDTYSDDDPDELDNDIASYSFSIRKAAAVSEARRQSDERNFFYMKIILVLLFCFWTADEIMDRRTGTTTTITDFDSKNSYKKQFQFNKRWKTKVNSMYVGVNDGRDDKQKKKILTILKDLDQSIHGDIFLRSNKTNFLDAAKVWQRRDWAFDEEAFLPSNIPSSLPPLAVVQAASVDDVKLGVKILGGLARDYNLEFRVRSGGFAYMDGYSTISDGIMLSLADLDTLTINDQKIDMGSTLSSAKGTNDDATNKAGSKIVTMGPGVRTEDFMKEVLDNNGYSGIVASAAGVGMGGFVLGGGYGLQSRLYGLAIDNLVGLEVVLPNGEVKSVKEDDDLFWALSGTGGGNIGIVTSMEYKVYPSHDIKLAASVKVSLEEMTHFLQQIADKESDLAPEFTLKIESYSPNREIADLNLSMPFDELGFGDEGKENGLVTVSMYWMGESNPDDQVGMHYIKDEIVPLFSNASRIDDVSYYYFSWSGISREREQNAEMNSVWSAQSWNGFLLPGNNTQEIWMDIQSSLSAMFTYCRFVSPRIELWGGAISKRSSNATVFPHRNAVYNIGIDVIVPSESDADDANDEIGLINAIWPSIARHLSGVYVNYPMPSLSDESYPTAYWGENLDRLKSLADRYDPSRVMKVAQGVPMSPNDTAS